MGQVVRRIEDQLENRSEVVHGFATVEEVRGRTVVYRSEARSGEARSGEARSGKKEAAIAADCLLEPAVGDRILVVERDSEAYVLCVLAREDGHRAKLRVEGDLELSVGGHLSVAATEGVDFSTSNVLRFVATAVKMRASEGELAVDRMVMLSREAVLNTRVAKVVTDALESFVERLSSHVKRSYRTVEEMESLRAKRIDYRCEEELALRGKHAFVDAADLVKVTGAQIHMG